MFDTNGVTGATGGGGLGGAGLPGFDPAGLSLQVADAFAGAAERQYGRLPGLFGELVGPGRLLSGLLGGLLIALGGRRSG